LAVRDDVNEGKKMKPKYLVYNSCYWYDGASECYTLEEAEREFRREYENLKPHEPRAPHDRYVSIAKVIKCITDIEKFNGAKPCKEENDTHQLVLADDLERQSFKNLVWFFQDELREIRSGTSPTSIASLTDGNIKRLHKYGVLSTSHHLVRGSQAVLTEAAKIIMEELE